MYRVLKDKYQVESNTGSFEFLLQFNVSWMTVNIFLDNTTIRDQIMIVFFFANWLWLYIFYNKQFQDSPELALSLKDIKYS